MTTRTLSMRALTKLYEELEANYGSALVQSRTLGEEALQDYVKSLARLSKAIATKQRAVQDREKLEDLMAMMKGIVALMDSARKELGNSDAQARRRRSSIEGLGGVRPRAFPGRGAGSYRRDSLPSLRASSAGSGRTSPIARLSPRRRSSRPASDRVSSGFGRLGAYGGAFPSPRSPNILGGARSLTRTPSEDYYARLEDINLKDIDLDDILTPERSYSANGQRNALYGGAPRRPARSVNSLRNSIAARRLFDSPELPTADLTRRRLAQSIAQDVPSATSPSTSPFRGRGGSYRAGGAFLSPRRRSSVGDSLFAEEYGSDSEGSIDLPYRGASRDANTLLRSPDRDLLSL